MTGAKRTQHARIEIYRDESAPIIVREGGEVFAWRWRLVGKNGKILADSGESYTRKHGVKRALGAVLEAISLARIIEA